MSQELIELERILDDMQFAPKVVYTSFSNPVNNKQERSSAVQIQDLYAILRLSRIFVETFKLENIIIDKYLIPKPSMPKLPRVPSEPIKPQEPSPPLPHSPKPEKPLRPKFTFKERVVGAIELKDIYHEFNNQKQKYNKKMKEWEQEWRIINIKNMEYREKLANYTELNNAHIKYSQKFKKYVSLRREFEVRIKARYKLILTAWEKDKQAYEEGAFDDKIRLAHLIIQYERFESEGTRNYFDLILKFSPLHFALEKYYDLHYEPKTKMLIMKNKSQHTYWEDLVKCSATETNKVIEFILYALPIKILFEISHMDYKNALESIVFNGCISFTDKATGHIRDEYILSVHADKEQIKSLKIENIEPKSCFRALKGVSASKISEYVPIPPILTFNKNDKRLVENKEIIKGLNHQTNLATVDWEDFEHLVRELFEKVFAQRKGTEVRITQASRDKGVDAIVFDPDPLLGGKIVIQAKRYNSTVEVSAIRDLYGTVLNEGANRGILVTTSYYGKDSYEFAKDKPLTLIDGSNLLHLFKEHGYEFKIDLKAAKGSS
jgi:restriction system protein